MNIEELERQAQEAHTEARLRSFLDHLEQELEQATVAYTRAQWERFSGQNPPDFEAVENAHAALFRTPTFRQTVLDWLTKAEDPALQRRLVLLERKFTQAQVDAQPEIIAQVNEVMAAINAFRPQVGSEEMGRAETQRVLRADADRDRRRAAWRAENPLGEQVEAGVTELIQRRNDLARRMGYGDYPELALSVQGVDPAWLQKTVRRLEVLTAAPYAATLERIRRDLGLDALEAWDVPYGLARMAGLPDDLFPRDRIVEWAAALAQSLGFRREALETIRVDTADLPYSGLCFGIDLPGDVRILANPQDGHQACAAFFHEFGHALHYTHVDQPTYSLKYGLEGGFDEGMARFFEHFTETPEWLRETVGVASEDAANFCAAQRAGALYKLRGSLAQALFEFEAYRDPHRELQRVWRSVRDQLMLTDSARAPCWAASPFYTMFPLYVHNYVVADVISAQTHAFLTRWYGTQAHYPEIAKLLIQGYYSPGASLPWPEKVRALTGQGPDSAALASQLTG